MREIQLEITSKFKVMSEEIIDYLEWNQIYEIPYYTCEENSLDDIDEDEYMLCVEEHIQQEIKKYYGAQAGVEFIYINLVSATEEISQETYYF